MLLWSASFSWWHWSSRNPVSAAWLRVPLGLTSKNRTPALGCFLPLGGGPSLWHRGQQMRSRLPWVWGRGLHWTLLTLALGIWGSLGLPGWVLLTLSLTLCDGGGLADAPTLVGIRFLLDCPFPNCWPERGFPGFAVCSFFSVSSRFWAAGRSRTHSRKKIKPKKPKTASRKLPALSFLTWGLCQSIFSLPFRVLGWFSEDLFLRYSRYLEEGAGKGEPVSSCLST